MALRHGAAFEARKRSARRLLGALAATSTNRNRLVRVQRMGVRGAVGGFQTYRAAS